MKASWEKISLSSPTRSHWLHWNLNLHFKKFSGTSFQPLQSHMRHLSHWAKQQKPIMWHSMTWGHAWQWSLEFFTVTRKFAKGISAALNKFYFTFLLYIWLKGYGLGMNCSFSSNPPEDDTALCVYIYLSNIRKHQLPQHWWSLLHKQENKLFQVQQSQDSLRLHDLDPALPPPELPLPATTPRVGHPNDCPSYTASGSLPPMPVPFPGWQISTGDLSPT